MINYMKAVIKDIFKLVLAMLGILIVWQMLFFALYSIDSDNGLVVLFAVYDILFFVVIISYAFIWCAIAFVPVLVGYLLCRNNEKRIKIFIGFTTVTYVLLCIYAIYMLYLIISMLVAGLNAWIYLIPIVLSAVILVQSMIKTFSGYKKIITTTYAAPNAYPVNYYPGNNYQANSNYYGYNNMNCNHPYASNISGGEYQQEQQYVNPNNNYYG